MVKILGLVLSITLISLPCFSLSLNDAYKDYLAGEYEEALTKAKKLHQNDEVLYFLGLVYIKYGSYPEARQYLLRLKNSYPRSSLHEQTLVKIADTYFLEADYIKAKELYQELEKMPSFEYLPLVYLRLAQIANREGKLEILQKYLDLIKNKFPNCSEMKYVNILESYKEGFYVQLGAFSSKKNATALQNELGEKYPVYIVEESEPGYTLYKVRVGKYKDRKEAEKIYARLLKEGFPGKIYP